MSRFFIVYSAILFSISPLYCFEMHFDSLAKQIPSTSNSAAVVFYDTVFNNTNDTLKLSCTYTEIQMPAGWTSSICVGFVCYATTKRTVQFSVAPQSLFLIDFNVNGSMQNDSAFLRVSVSNDEDTADKQEQTIKVGPNQNPVIMTTVPVVNRNNFTYMRQASQLLIYIKLVRDDYVKADLISLQGKTCARYYKGRLTCGVHCFVWQLPAIASGTYEVRLLTADKPICKNIYLP